VRKARSPSSSWSSDDLPEATTDPAHRRAARDLQLREQVGIPAAHDLLLRCGGHKCAVSDGASAEETTVKPIGIGDKPVAEKASDLAVCKCIATAPECSTP
jgi:hypothetical protein